MKRNCFSLLTILLVFFASGQELSPSKKRQIQKLIKSKVYKDSPGLAIGIVMDGNIVFESYDGLADVPKKVPISEKSRFNYASCGKQFTALAILKLAADSKISQKEDFRKYANNLYTESADTILIENLINHSSGIRDVYDLWSLQGITWWEETFSNHEALKLLSKQEDLNFKVGSRHLYSNSNYLILTDVIKTASGKSFKEYTDQLFSNLGMDATAFEPNHLDIQNRVLPYGFWKRYREYDWNSDLHGDGALFTTLPDQLKFEIMLQTKRSDFLDSSTLSKSQLLVAGSSISDYGYGLEFSENMTFHHGSTGAYGGSFFRYPEEQISIVVLTNYSNISTSQVGQQVYDILKNGKFPESTFPTGPEVPGPVIPESELLGTYFTSGGYYYKFFQDKDKLYLERPGREDVEVAFEADNIYYEVSDPDFKQAFERVDGNLRVTAFYPTHDPYSLEKKEITWNNYNFKSIEGTYYSSELDLKFKVTYAEDDRYLIKGGKRDWEIAMIEPGILTIEGRRATFNTNDQGVVDALLINSSRNRNIKFVRM